LSVREPPFAVTPVGANCVEEVAEPLWLHVWNVREKPWRPAPRSRSGSPRRPRNAGALSWRAAVTPTSPCRQALP